MKARRLQAQPRIPGVVRIPSHSGFLPQLRTAVEREARRWGVSPSFVVATAAAFALGVEEQPSYKKVKPARVLYMKRRAG